MKTRACRLVGGPYKGWSGEFVDKGQQSTAFGPEGGKSFVYRRRAADQPGKPIVFEYDRTATADTLRAAGVSPEDIQAAVQLRRPPSKGRAAIKVDVVPLEKVWSMRWNDEEVATMSKSELPDRESVRQWVASVFLPHLPKESVPR